ncbi:MAG: hypothetical protein ABSF62_02355 [Bryobacteraceae bacterium]
MDLNYATASNPSTGNEIVVRQGFREGTLLYSINGAPEQEVMQSGRKALRVAVQLLRRYEAGYEASDAEELTLP